MNQTYCWGVTRPQGYDCPLVSSLVKGGSWGNQRCPPPSAQAQRCGCWSPREQSEQLRSDLWLQKLMWDWGESLCAIERADWWSEPCVALVTWPWVWALSVGDALWFHWPDVVVWLMLHGITQTDSSVLLPLTSVVPSLAGASCFLIRVFLAPHLSQREDGGS